MGGLMNDKAELKCEIEQLKKDKEELQKDLEKIKKQKPTTNKSQKKKHQHLVGVLQRENEILLREKLRLIKQFNEEKKVIIQKASSFEEMKISSVRLKKKCDSLQNMNHEVLVDCRKERDTLLEETLKNKQLANKYESKLNELKKLIKTYEAAAP